MLRRKDLETRVGPRRTGFRAPFASARPGAVGRGCVRLAREHTALILLVVLVIAGGLLSDVFLTLAQPAQHHVGGVDPRASWRSARRLLLITCNFDMSVAFVVGLAGIVTVLAQICRPRPRHLDGARPRRPASPIGLVNGLLVVYTGANPFLITLGTALARLCRCR